MANFDSLVFPGFQATQKIHAQNSRPELLAFLSNFTFLNPKFIHGDFLLTGETNQFHEKSLGNLVNKCNVQERLRFFVLSFSDKDSTPTTPRNSQQISVGIDGRSNLHLSK